MRSHTAKQTTRNPLSDRDGRVRRKGSKTRLTLTEIVLLALCLLAIVGALLVSAGPAVPADMDSRAIRVDAGQTLWDLAQTHHVRGLSTADTVELIRSMNALPSSGLEAGAVVLVPAGDALQTTMAAR